MNSSWLAKVHHIIDGDSLEVKTEDGLITEIRLYGIDAPERGQPFANEARTGLYKMLGRQTFWLEEQHIDPYGHKVALLHHRDQSRRNSVNLRMIREGLAYAYTKYGGEELGFHQAQADARQGRRGIWEKSDEGGERPWEHRRDNQPGPDMSLTSKAVIILFALLILLFTVSKCI